MAKKKTPGGTAGKGGVNPAPTRDNQTVRIAAEARYMALQVPPEDASFARALDAQAEQKKTVYGACFLLSEKAAAEKAAAEKRAQFVWELSDREKALVKSLGKHGGAV